LLALPTTTELVGRPAPLSTGLALRPSRHRKHLWLRVKFRSQVRGARSFPRRTGTGTRPWRVVEAAQNRGSDFGGSTASCSSFSCSFCTAGAAASVLSKNGPQVNRGVILIHTAAAHASAYSGAGFKAGHLKGRLLEVVVTIRVIMVRVITLGDGVVRAAWQAHPMLQFRTRAADTGDVLVLWIGVLLVPWICS